jgi:hypothetical protein
MTLSRRDLPPKTRAPSPCPSSPEIHHLELGLQASRCSRLAVGAPRRRSRPACPRSRDPFRTLGALRNGTARLASAARADHSALNDRSGTPTAHSCRTRFFTLPSRPAAASFPAWQTTSLIAQPRSPARLGSQPSRTSLTQTASGSPKSTPVDRTPARSRRARGSFELLWALSRPTMTPPQSARSTRAHSSHASCGWSTATTAGTYSRVAVTPSASTAC